VAGATLAALELYPYIKNEFLIASDKVDVVLACRVSPK
jgi:hypothetical protein